MSTTEQLNAGEIKHASDRMQDWWRLDAAIEKLKTVWVGMSERGRDVRGPEDYEISQADVRKMMRGMASLLSRPTGNINNEGGDGANHRILSWILGVMAALAVSAICGSFALYGRLTSLEATVSSGIAAHEARLQRLENLNERRYRGDPTP